MLTGDILGPYRVLEKLGEGGMGQVYRARDTKLNRDVALKVLPDSFANDPDRLARFTREAQTLAALNHPNIAHIHGLEESGGVRALVMELVEGDDLSQLIVRRAGLQPRQGLPLDEALPIAKQIAEALEAAHDQGIIHRDLKPANIKVRPDGTVKVLDFGLAKAVEGDSGQGIGAGGTPLSQAPTITTPAMMTGVGMILGTAAYMSPEQAKGRTVDRRADVWAFGAVLFEMLSGQRAFAGEDVADTLANVLKMDPDWQHLPAAVPARVRQVIRACLQKDPKQRIGDVQSVRLALDGAFETTAVPKTMEVTSTIPPLWRRALPVAAGAVLTAVIVAGVAWSLRPTPAPPAPIAQFSIEPPDGQPLTVESRQSIAISPDGKRLVFKANNRLFVRGVGEIEATQVVGVSPGVANSPVMSPDGESVVFQTNADRTLKRMPVAGGPLLTIAQDVDNPMGMSWGPGGIVFALGQGAASDGVFRVSPDGGTPERLAEVATGEVAFGPQILPGGEFLMFTLAKADGADRWDTAKIVMQSLASGERRTIIQNGSDARYLPTGRGSPKRAEREGGHIVYSVGGTLYGVVFDLATRTVRGEAVPVLTGVRRSGGQTGMTQVAISTDGSLLYVTGPLIPEAGGTARVPTLTDRSGRSQPLALPPKPYTRPRVSPDGSRLAVGVEEGDGADIWIYELAGTTAIRRLTFNGRNRFPVWSPDGRRVAFQSDRDGRQAIYVQAADGGGVAERLTDPAQGGTHMPDSWSPDGRTLLFSEQKSNRAYALMALSMADKQVLPVAGVEGREPPEAVFSPDGRWVAYNLNKGAGGVPSPDRGIFVQPFPPTGATYQVPKTRLDFHPTWGPSGREIFYVPTTSADELVGVSVQMTPSPQFGTPAPLKGVTEPGLVSTSERGYDVLLDGRFITMLPAATAVAGTAAELRIVLNWFEELKRLVPTK